MIIKARAKRIQPQSIDSLSRFCYRLKLLFLVTAISACLGATAHANDVVPGEYVGKWKDNIKQWSGRFILVIESITDDNISGTIKFRNAGNCQKTVAFSSNYTGNNHLEFSVDSKSNCGDFDLVLDYQNGVFDGTYIDALGKGKLINVKPK